MKRLSVLLLIFAIAGCAAPPQSVPPNLVLPMGIGTGAGCSLSPIGGPWDDTHQFPRIITTDGDYNVADSNTSNLSAIARYDGVLWTLDWPTYQNYAIPPPVATPFAYVRALNASTKFIGVNHSYNVSPAYCHIATTYPHRCAIVTAQDTADGYTASGDGWYAKDSSGTVIPFTLAAKLMNWSNLDPDNPVTDWPTWFGNYIVDEVWNDQCSGVRCWDGFYFESMNTPHSLSTFYEIDADENGITDHDESVTRCEIDERQLDGYRTFFGILATGGITVAGGEGDIEPGIAGGTSDPYLLNYASAGYNGDFPRASYPDCSDNTYDYPPNNSKWDYNMRQAIKWEDTGALVINLAGENLYGAGGDSYYRTYVTDWNQQQRLVVGSTLLINGYSVPHQDQVPQLYPCDECLVNGSGASTTAIADGGWLGCPLYDAVNSAGKTLRTVIAESGNLAATYWTREFENGLVVVNPTTATVNVPVGAGWKRILANASYGGDTTHNSGAAVTSPLSVGAYDVFVLVRDTAGTATPAPTATPAATFTPTPTRTPTPIPTDTPTAGPSPTPTDTPTAGPTSTPTDTPTPRPTSTDTPTPIVTATTVPDLAGTPCPGFDATGVVILRNPAGQVVETVVYASGGNNSYCATNWQTPPPVRTWTATGTPNPGTAPTSAP